MINDGIPKHYSSSMIIHPILLVEWGFAKMIALGEHSYGPMGHWFGVGKNRWCFVLRSSQSLDERNPQPCDVDATGTRAALLDKSVDH